MRRWAGAALATLVVAGGVAGGLVISGDQTGGVCEWPSCFPDATNTGVPSGTSLTPHSGDLTVSTNGATVNALDVSGTIIVTGHGVTIQNSEAKGIETSGSTAENPANPPMIVQDVNIVCDDTDGSTGVRWANYEVYRTEMVGCENGIYLDNDAILEDSYIHSMHQCDDSACTEPDAHTDGVQGDIGDNTTIRHNNISAVNMPCDPGDGSCNGTSAININNNGSNPASDNVLIINNLLAGGANTLYCPVTEPSTFTVTDNSFNTEVPFSALGEDCGDNTQSGNIEYPSGDPVTLD
jgi:hypothetical protein